MSQFTVSYKRHLSSSDDLITSYNATRAGFVALALEKNRRATPYIAQARALQEAAMQARKPADLLAMPGIEAGLLAAAGLSDKALVHLQPEDKIEAIRQLMQNFLEPAGDKFVEELVFRFLLTRGDALGGSMRNMWGSIAQRKLTRAILSNLSIAGIEYTWQHSRSRAWIPMTNDDAEIEWHLRGIAWKNTNGPRTLLYNFMVPLIKNNVDLCLLSLEVSNANRTVVEPDAYLALGELKGGIDPAGADEHWKTASTALQRIRQAFASVGRAPALFFIGAAVEKKMAHEIWTALQIGDLANAANLNDENQLASISNWLCTM